jgi:hypothetical protein
MKKIIIIIALPTLLCTVTPMNSEDIAKKESWIKKIANSTKEFIGGFFTSEYTQAVKNSENTFAEEENNRKQEIEEALKNSLTINAEEIKIIKALEQSITTHIEEDKAREEYNKIIENTAIMSIIDNNPYNIFFITKKAALSNTENFLTEFLSQHNLHSHEEKDSIKYPLGELVISLNAYNETMEEKAEIIKTLMFLESNVKRFTPRLLNRFNEYFKLSK